MTALTLSSRNSTVETLSLKDEGVLLLDQTCLPTTVRSVLIQSVEAMAVAIETMIVRGAPAIGIAAAYGVVLSARAHQSKVRLTDFQQAVEADIARLAVTRPTAVNLTWALEQMKGVLQQSENPPLALESLTRLAVQLHQADLAANMKMGQYGATLVPKGARILTHCNAGALATAGYGTALGVIRAAFERDPSIQVFADETRPRLQGARLTAWELAQDGIPVTLVSDNMVAHLMGSGKIDLVIVGADRVAANGDAANKIGTCTVAVVAKHFNIPFYMALPASSFDCTLSSGADIPIEERDAEELYQIGAERVAPETGVGYYNPAFDVTPNALITALITEHGIIRPPFTETIRQVLSV